MSTLTSTAMTTPMTTSIAIYGAGSTGCYLGAVLSLAGFNVSLICRQRIKDNIIENQGITITDYMSNHHKVMPFELITELDGQCFDVVFVMLKCHALPSAAEDLLAMTDKQSALVFMQNGLGSLNPIKDLLADRQLLTGITPFNVLQKDGAVFHKGTEGDFVFEQFKQASVIKSAMSEQGFECQLATAMEPIIYGKLLLNLNNALNAIIDLPIKQEFENRVFRRLLADAMTEWINVARAMGVELAQFTVVKPKWVPVLLRSPDWLFPLLAKKMLAIDPEARSSMWEDIQAKRKTEIEFLNGAVVELGKQHGIATPVNALICDCIARLERGEAVDITQSL